MNLVNLTFVIIILLFCSNCSKKSTKYNVKSEIVFLEKNKEITNFSDSIFLANVLDIEIIDGQYHFADYAQNSVFILNKNWELQSVFGRKGSGPSEFDGLSNISYNQNYIYVSDMESSSIKVFDKKLKFVNTLKTPHLVTASLEFTVDDSSFFYQYSNRYAMINKYDSYGEILTTYGDFEKDYTIKTKKRNNYQTNQWHAILSNKKLYSINLCEPLILVYEKESGKKIGSYDLSKVDILQNRLKYIDKEIEADPYANSNFILFGDVIVKDNDLYLLLTNNDNQRNKVLSNQILHLRLVDESNFEEVAVYQLNPYGWYEAFTIDADQLIAFDSYSSSIEVYQIPN